MREIKIKRSPIERCVCLCLYWGAYNDTEVASAKELALPCCTAACARDEGASTFRHTITRGWACRFFLAPFMDRLLFLGRCCLTWRKSRRNFSPSSKWGGNRFLFASSGSAVHFERINDDWTRLLEEKWLPLLSLLLGTYRQVPFPPYRSSGVINLYGRCGTCGDEIERKKITSWLCVGGKDLIYNRSVTLNV